MIKKTLLTLAALALLIASFGGATAFAEEAYYFENFSVTVYVNSDYTFEVVESITCEFNDERHGIRRSLPNYWGDDRIKYTDMQVDGAPLKIERSQYYTTLRIGDAKRTITGTQQYTISYTIALPPDSNPSLDTVYMNVIGYDHPVYTMSSTIRVILPEKVLPDYIGTFSGYYEEDYDNGKVTYEYDGKKTLTLELNKPLNPYEGITVKIDLEEGYFKNVKKPFFLDEFMKGYLPTLFILTGIIIWLIFGRDRKVIPPVEINPPDVSPVEAGYIIDGQVDGDDVAAMIIFWASLGFLRIEDEKTKGSYKFYKLKEIDEQRPKYEKELFNYLFKMKDDEEYVTTSTVKSRLGSKGTSFKGKVVNKYKKGGKQLITDKSKSFSAFVTVLAYLCFAIIGFFLALSEGVGTAIMLAGFSLIPFSFLQLWLRFLLMYRRKRRFGSSFLRSFIFGLVTLVFWLIIVGIASESTLSFEHATLMYFGSLFLVVLAYYTQQMTEYGHDQYERVLGFRHFMVTAEKDWLERLAKDDPEFFYDRLPYALVLGVSRVWIGKFADAVVAPPLWYSGTYTTFNTRTFASTMTSDFSRIGAYAVPSSSSSGGSYRSGSSSFSSGGGFSGGGHFSGGGSSSW